MGKELKELPKVISRVGKDFKVLAKGLSAGQRKRGEVLSKVISRAGKELNLLAKVISRAWKIRSACKGYKQGRERVKPAWKC